MNAEINGVNVGSKIPLRLKELLKHAVNNGYLNTSDFVRDAIKEKLEREGYFSISKKAEAY